MAYQIVEVRPTYCQITDGIIGNSYHTLPFEFHSLDQAEKTAGVLHDRDYHDCGDNCYFVKPAGENCLTKWGQPNRAHSAVETFEEVPF